MNKDKNRIVFFLLLLFLQFQRAAHSEEVKFVSELPSPSEYDIFANGGWNGNWYVGWNHSWVSCLPPMRDLNKYEKAYLGARLGRAKTLTQIIESGKSTDTLKLENTDTADLFYIGVSSSPYIRPEGSVLADNREIPLEGSSSIALSGVSASRWFWTEIDISRLSSITNNCLHVWTDSKNFDSVQNAPILAAGLGSDKIDNSYLVEGSSRSIVKSIRFFEPALAIKLIDKTASYPSVEINEIRKHPVRKEFYVIDMTVRGNNITESGIQLNIDGTWQNYGRLRTEAPYTNILDASELQPGRYKIRCWVKNWSEKSSYSAVRSFTVE